MKYTQLLITVMHAFNQIGKHICYFFRKQNVHSMLFTIKPLKCVSGTMHV
jgi:hypothetical protein